MPRPGDEDAVNGKSLGCVYDIWNRLVRVYDDADGDGVQGTGEETIAEYRYDGLNRRIHKFVRVDGGVSADTWTVRDDYFNSNWQLLETRKAEGQSRSGSPLSEPAVATAVYCQYVWSPKYIDALICRDRDVDGDLQTNDLGVMGSGLDERLVYLYDANYNVTAVIGQWSSVWGVCERYRTDKYRPPQSVELGVGIGPGVGGHAL